MAALSPERADTLDNEVFGHILLATASEMVDGSVLLLGLHWEE